MTSCDKFKSSKNQCWQTPPDFLDLVRQVAHIALDPCTTAANPTKALNFFTEADDGLALRWDTGTHHPRGLVYVNPPYGRALPAWADKVAQEAANGLELLVLVPARVDTRWFRKLQTELDVVLFWSGRIKFVDPATGKQGDPALFPSAVFYQGPDRDGFESAFAGTGWVAQCGQQARRSLPY